MPRKVPGPLALHYFPQNRDSQRDSGRSLHLTKQQRTTARKLGIEPPSFMGLHPMPSPRSIERGPVEAIQTGGAR